VLEPVEGLGAFLAWIERRGLRKAAVTNAPRANSIAMLRALGLACAPPERPIFSVFFFSYFKFLFLIIFPAAAGLFKLYMKNSRLDVWMLERRGRCTQEHHVLCCVRTGCCPPSLAVPRSDPCDPEPACVRVTPARACTALLEAARP